MSTETVLITGASSGIGLELARLFAADGANLVLVARNQAALDDLARELTERHGCRIEVLPLDLTEPSAPGYLFQSLADAGVRVDVLVNNAGFGARGTFADLDPERQLQMVQLNVTALTRLSRLFLPGMIDRGRGGILNLASVAAFAPGPGMAVYYATKAYVLSLSQALAEEVRGKGVSVCCLAPGPADTGFGKRADMEDMRLYRLAAMSPARVARAGHQGLRQGRALVVPGVANRLVVFFLKLLPTALVRRLVALGQS